MGKNEKVYLTVLFAVGVFIALVLCFFRTGMKFSMYPRGTYQTLPPSQSEDDPLLYLADDFEVLDGFHTNLPIVILSVDGEFPDYKTFKNSEEIVYEGVDPYIGGEMTVIDTGSGVNTLSDKEIYKSNIRIKIKGHSSYGYDKKQYKIKALNEDGTDNDLSILGMGEGSEWVLNGSLADKSMMRNYLAYRIASEIDGNNMAPDSRYCEVLMRENGKLFYQGVFLIMETVSRGEDRVKIKKYNPGSSISGYILRRDRKTEFDIMLDTYGRQSGRALGKDDNENDNWIGIKYPSQSKITDQTIEYITKDFSKIEQILYSSDESVFKTYDRYINTDSFVDYFLINEFFGNYDAGEHSTYMYKNAGDVLYIGPVWDFDQAINNNETEETDPYNLAFEMQPLFKELTNDKRFVRKLKSRYAYLRSEQLAEEHIFGVIDEVSAYLKDAQVREWYRWADDYLDGSGLNPHNYTLHDIEENGMTLSRFTDRYSDEIYVIKKYIHEHADAIQADLTGVLGSAEYDFSIGGMRELLFIAVISLILMPSYLIQRKG